MDPPYSFILPDLWIPSFSLRYLPSLTLFVCTILVPPHLRNHYKGLGEGISDFISKKGRRHLRLLSVVDPFPSEEQTPVCERDPRAA